MTDIVVYSSGSSSYLPEEYLSTETTATVIRRSNDISRTYTLPFQLLPSPNSTTTTTTFLIEQNDRRSSALNSSTPMDHANRTIPVEILSGRRLSNADEHYDYPGNVLERRRTPTIVPFNNLKRMDHLNTIFVRPTRIERPLPKLVFQENDKENNGTSNPPEAETNPDESQRSSPLFYEELGLPEIDDDQVKNDGRKHVKFSTAPIRVYPTYSANEYDRRNEDIDPFSASAEYELEKRIEKMDVFEVEIERGAEGLGMSVLGMGVGADSGLEKLGIFVKALNPQGVIARDGRIQVGDQIIEVNENYMVGVTHQFATNVLKTTSGKIRFLIGREKDPENSEILRLIQRSLQIDQERDESSRTSVTPTQDEGSMKTSLGNEYEMEILKECFESLEKTLENTEKERDHFQQLYQKTLKDFQEMEEKYRKATELIQELQDREIQMKEDQCRKQEQQRKYIAELIGKIDDLERTVVEIKLNQSNDQSDRTDPTDSSTRSRPVDQCPNPWQKRSIHSKSMDRIEPMQNSEVIRLPPKELLIRYSSKSISDHVGTQSSAVPDLISNSTLFFNTPSVGATASTNNDQSVVEEYVEVKDWSSDQCIQWLSNENLSEFIPLFLNRSIDGEKLLSLDSAKMKAIGIKSTKDRDRLKQKLKALKHADLDQIRDRLLSSRLVSIERPPPKSHRFRSSSLNKLKDRRLFTTMTNEDKSSFN